MKSQCASEDAAICSVISTHAGWSQLDPTIFPDVLLSLCSVHPAAGFWLFSRKPVDPANTAIMRQEAARLGFDLSVLKKVQQEGCTF